MIKGVLIVNESGKARLSKFYEDIVNKKNKKNLIFFFFLKLGTFTSSESSS